MAAGTINAINGVLEMGYGLQDTKGPGVMEAMLGAPGKVLDIGAGILTPRGALNGAADFFDLLGRLKLIGEAGAADVPSSVPQACP
jgi:hypothetical protein